MALIEDAAETWSAPVTLGGDEVWQTRRGAIYLTTTTSPATDDGILLVEGQGILIRSGRQVRYRAAQGAEALIAREGV